MVLESQSPGELTVPVLLGQRSYPIHIGTGQLTTAATGAPDSLRAALAETLPDLTHLLLLADEAVGADWGRPVARKLAETGIKVDTLEIPSGEPSKSLEQLARIWQWMLECGADRRSVVAALGGGVTGDLAGFAAATFTRGVRFVQLPTTLLAMVDSSVGGKTGINLPAAKNMVGAFWQPSLVLIDTDVLATLPERSYLSGLAEVIKYGVIDDADFFQWLETEAASLVERQPDAVRQAVAESCRSKARVVGEDERETSGRRAILNYGHTFAHAIEATAGYGELLHGEAVAIGMQMAARLAVDLAMAPESLLQRQRGLIEACGLPTTLASADPGEMIPVMRRDKKVAHGKLRFVLPSALGSVQLVSDVDETAVAKAIEACR